MTRIIRINWKPLKIQGPAVAGLVTRGVLKRYRTYYEGADPTFEPVLQFRGNGQVLPSLRLRETFPTYSSTPKAPGSTKGP